MYTQETAGLVNVAVAPQTLNTTILSHIPVVEAVSLLIFNYSACLATEVNRTVALVKFTIERWVQIAVTTRNQIQLHIRHNNVPEPQKKGQDAKTKPPIQVVDATYTIKMTMKTSILFALDSDQKEVLVSETQKGSNQVTFIQRISYQENELLYDAVAQLTKITTTPNLDLKIFKAMDHVCQLIYLKHLEKK